MVSAMVGSSIKITNRLNSLILKRARVLPKMAVLFLGPSLIFKSIPLSYQK